MFRFFAPALIWAAVPALGPISESDLSSLCADRTAIERVYHEHRVGTKPPFEQVLPASAIRDLVKRDLHKASILKKVYNVEITAPDIHAEVKRIESTSRAPDILRDLQGALGDDAARFATSVAKPLLVERRLRALFEADHKLHAAQRRQADALREKLLAAKSNGAPFEELFSTMKSHPGMVSETTWQLTGAAQITPAAKASGGAYSLEGTARLAAPDAEPKRLFSELAPDLQKVLLAQMRNERDVSAVIETSGAFCLYLAKRRTDATLSTVSLSIPKRDYEKWLSEQRD